MSDSVLSTGLYRQLVRITEDERGNPVDWVGCFGYLDARTAEGLAFEAVLENGRPILQKANEGKVRLYTDRIKFTLLGHFRWRRRGDSNKFHLGKDKVSIPCISVESVTMDHLIDDPEFTTIARKIAILRPKKKGRELTVGLRFEDEVDRSVLFFGDASS